MMLCTTITRKPVLLYNVERFLWHRNVQIFVGRIFVCSTENKLNALHSVNRVTILPSIANWLVWWIPPGMCNDCYGKLNPVN